jgi:hypothetical protein
MAPDPLKKRCRQAGLLIGLGLLGAWAAAEEGAIPSLKVELEGPPEAPQEPSRVVLAGAEVVRQVRFRQEGDAALRVAAFWNVRWGEEILVQGEWFRKLEPGQEVTLPLRFQAPPVSQRVELLLTLTVQVGEAVVASPEVRLAVLPAPSRSPAAVERFALFDPRGETAALLEQAGVRCTLLATAEEAAALKRFRLLVVGSGALDFGNEGFLRQVDRLGWVAAGGNMLVLEQPPCNLLNLDFIPADFSDLRSNDPIHPALAGLPFVDWSSPGLLRGGSVFFRKPHRGNFRVLVDAGAEGESTPLLEWYVGQGKALLCQLPVTQLSPSAGTIWMETLLRAAARPSDMAWQQVAYVGGSQGRDLLARLGAEAAFLKPGADLKRFGVLLTDGRGLEGQGGWIQAFTRKGGVVCVLGGRPEELAAWVPFTLDGEVRPVGRVHLAEGLRGRPWLRGLSAADLAWEPAQEVPIWTSLPPEAETTEPAVFAAVPVGKGYLLFWQALPWEGEPVWQKCTRLLSTLLTNLGVPLRLPGLTFFSNEASLNNRQPSGPWVVPLREWQFRIDPRGLGLEQGWFKPDYDADSWPLLRAGASWESQGVTRPHPTIVHADPAEQAQQYDGLAWYRIRCLVPAALAGREVHFQAGGINDYDWLYVNGQEVASTEEASSLPGAPRDYLLPPTVLRFGEENVLALRIFNSHGPGGLTRAPVQLAAFGATAPSPYLAGP